MRLLHSPARTRVVFDDPNLLAHAGLAPLLALADRAGLPGLLAGAAPAGPCGANPVTKAMCLVAGMSVGADSIDDRLCSAGSSDVLCARRAFPVGDRARNAKSPQRGSGPPRGLPLQLTPA